MATTQRCSGGGLMFAGLIVMLVGLAVVVIRTMELPGYWTPVVVGAVLFLVGAGRRAMRSRDDPRGPDRARRSIAQTVWRRTAASSSSRPSPGPCGATSSPPSSPGIDLRMPAERGTYSTR
jgi:hypothetical protein